MNKSKPYAFLNDLFRYDFDNCLVECIYKAGDEELADNAEWMKSYGKPLFDIDSDGYMVITSAGLSKDNWTNKGARDEYLAAWVDEIEEEGRILAEQYLRYG